MRRAVIYRPRPKSIGGCAADGDSITAGFGLSSPLTERYTALAQAIVGEDIEVTNFATSGERIDQMIEDTAEIDATLVSGSRALNIYYCMGGINDLTNLISVQGYSQLDAGREVVRRLKRLSRQQREAGWGVIVFSEMVGGEGDGFDYANTWLREDAVNDGYCDAVALPWTNVPALQDRDDEDLFQDGTHPTAEGNVLIAPEVAAAWMRGARIYLEAA